MWQLIREIASDAMAKFTAEHSDNKDVNGMLNMDFDELQKLFRDVCREVRKSNDIAPLLRKQLPVYPV